jgi:hypothetical protein
MLYEIDGCPIDRKWSGMERMRERMERRPYGGGLALGVWQHEEDIRLRLR